MGDVDRSVAVGANMPGGYVTPWSAAAAPCGGHRGRTRHSCTRCCSSSKERGFKAAPRFVGVDDEGHEVLSLIEGHVAWAGEQPPGVWSDESLIAVAGLVRRLHDLTAGTTLGGDREVVIHADLAPRNTVYLDRGEGYRPVTFIDWDNARPADRLEDVADMLWHYLCPCPDHAGTLLLRRMRSMCDAYGLVSELRRDLPRLMHLRMREVMHGIETKAAHGSLPHTRLVAMGALTDIRYQADWVARNLAELDAALT